MRNSSGRICKRTTREERISASRVRDTAVKDGRKRMVRGEKGVFLVWVVGSGWGMRHVLSMTGSGR